MPVYVLNSFFRSQCLYDLFNSFFLVYAAHVVTLGITWRLSAQAGSNYAFDTSYDQNTEITAINTAIRVLEFCGQRNAFARKYALLLKELRSQLHSRPSGSGQISTLAPSSVSSASQYGNSQVLEMQGTFSASSISHDELLRRAGSDGNPYAVPGNLPCQEGGAPQSSHTAESRKSSLSGGNLDGMGYDLSWLERDSSSPRELLFPGTFFGNPPLLAY